MLPSVQGAPLSLSDISTKLPEGKPVAFCLDPETGFSWIGEYDITADELLSGAGGNTATKTEQAERLILDLLADGKELASEDIVKPQPKPEYPRGRCRTPSATWAAF